MTTTIKDTPKELIRRAIIGIDEEIAQLQETRAQLAKIIGQPASDLVMKVEAPQKPRKLTVEAPQKPRKLTVEAREKIRAAAKARWARVRKEESQVAKGTTKKAESKSKPKKAESKGKAAKA